MDSAFVIYFVRSTAVAVGGVMLNVGRLARIDIILFYASNRTLWACDLRKIASIVTNLFYANMHL